MEKPKLEDFSLNETSEEFLRKFDRSMQRRSGWFTFAIVCISWGSMFWLSANPKSLGFNNDTITSAIFILLFYFPFFFADWPREEAISKFLSSSSEYSLYKQTKENKEKYDEKLDEYNKFQQRQFIKTKFKDLVILQNRIYKKRITSDNLSVLLELEEILEQLKDCNYRMTWEETTNFKSFQQYIRQRKRSYKDNTKRTKKQTVFTSENTSKIIVVETQGDHSNNNVEDLSQRSFEGRQLDFDEINKENASLGLKGELAILTYEREILQRNNRGDLAEKIKHVAKEEGDGTGYDILSCDLDGNPKYIEVKTTKRGKQTPFILSENEAAFIKHQSKYCSIYRLYNFDERNQSGNLIIANGYDEIMEKFSLKTSQYKVSIR